MQASPSITHPTQEWYLHARFGLFIHWGIYSVAGVEASWPIMAPDLAEIMFGNTTRISQSEYFALAERFNPVDFDAADWVRTARNAGIRYIIFTAKHHDGFCMFDAPGTEFKITRTQFGRDICLELAQACADDGMPLGFYYSPPDMHHPGYRDTRKPALKNWLGEPHRPEWAQYLDYMESHLRKLLTEYGPVKVLWFDGLSNHAKYDPPRFHALIHQLSPGTLINDRLGNGYDFITPEQFIPKDGIPVRTGKPPAAAGAESDRFFRLVQRLYRIPGIRGWMGRQIAKYQDGSLELTPVLQEPFPSPERYQPWETCMTMGQTWGFNPDETNWKAPADLLRNLVEVASRGGNYLLNVGPKGCGSFPPESLERLEYIGKWMRRYGESIYATTYTPLQNLTWGRATRKGDIIFLHIFDWPHEGKLVVPDLPETVQSASLMNGEILDLTQTSDRLEITLPPQTPDPDISVLVIETT